MPILVLNSSSPTLKFGVTGAPSLVFSVPSPMLKLGTGGPSVVVTSPSTAFVLGMAGPQGAQGERGDRGPTGPSGSGAATTITLPCDPAVSVGDLVALADGELVIASAADIARLPVLGCVTAKPSSADATIQVAGIVSGLYADLALGTMCFVGVDGRPVSGPPAPAPGGDVFLQPVGVALDAATLLLSPSMTISHVYAEP
jgi:hypothetical protein